MSLLGKDHFTSYFTRYLKRSNWLDVNYQSYKYLVRVSIFGMILVLKKRNCVIIYNKSHFSQS
jgi:hypothetical protein